MRKTLQFLIVCIMLCNSALLFAQTQATKTVTGQVRDEVGLPIPAVSVFEKGTSNGTTTDANGAFSIKVNSGKILVFKSIGFIQKEITIGSATVLGVVLKEEATSLKDVVVVAYGTQKKVNVTGAVDVITSKQLENRPVTSPSALLQGTAPSLMFSTPAGGNTPGSSPTVQIRGQALLSGATTPLVVIDGIPAVMGDFNAMNPNDIESVSVLKDAAAAAVYGARAPFGVLVVTTKMGKKNEKPVFTYSVNFANVSNVRTPHTVDSYTFALSRNQAFANSGSAQLFTPAVLDMIQDNVNNPGKYTLEQLNPNNGLAWSNAAQTYNNNDWFDVFFRTSFRQQHDFSVKGGTDKVNYFVSASFVDQPGVFNFIEDIDKYKRYNFNGGLVAQVNDWMKLTYRTRYSLSNTLAPTGTDNDRNRFYQFAYGAWPTIPVKNTTGQYSALSQILAAKEGGNSDNKSHLLDNILGLDLDLAKGWTAHVDGTWRVAFNDNQTLRKPVYEIAPNGALNPVQFTDVSQIAKTNSLGTYRTLQGYTAYEHNFGKHNFRVQGGAQIEENNAKYLTGSNLNLYIIDMPSIATSYGTTPFLTDEINDNAVAGVFGRFNYNYNDRYLLEVNGRYDGSGRYAADKRWGFFPSVSAGWNMSNENFWKVIEPVVNRAKLRASYGTVGNQGQTGFQHISTMAGSPQSAWIFDGKRLPFVSMPGILNFERTWEKFTTADFGLELGFLNNRLTTEFDYFNRLSWDMIGPPTPLPNVLGDTAPPVNNAAMETKGWEAQVKWTDKITSRWDYSVGVNLSDALSKVTKYNTTVNSLSGWYVGKELGEIWGYTSNRLLNANDFAAPVPTAGAQPIVSQSKIHPQWYPGDVKYEDLDGDGLISAGNLTLENHGDLRKIGNSTPRYRFAFNLATGYSIPKAGRVDVSAFLEGVGKRDLFMSSSYFYWGNMYTGSTIGTGIYQGKQLDYYRDANSNPRLLAHLGENVDAYFPRPYSNAGGQGAKNFATNTRYMMSGAYMRLKNVMATYTLPNEWLKHAKIQNCRLYFSAENIGVLSKLPNYIDPEFVNGGQMYPEQATYSFGVNLGF
ncbi:SusC/RagA family TonB-linked outer membrane protein [Solitalea lacus]|uniref:SusC/RagA family TonB-linked outer membrane protein n=1 Tax=Solitalea lacus TaxID=2911172 RepID=UPI001EDC6B79|nr:TonB-dependent receptor [Solitalea lacus]UKJ07946.1 TonB-dependent receptor [Solitalea lacus]